MRQRRWLWLIFILIVAAVAVLIDVVNGNVNILGADKKIEIRRGLDLQGGLQVLMEAQDPNTTRDQMDVARTIIGQRVNALNVTEPNLQVVGNNRLLVELPGISDPQQAINLIQETGLLEFVDTGSQGFNKGTLILTDHPISGGTGITNTTGVTNTASITGTGTVSNTVKPATQPDGKPFHTVLTGAALASAQVGRDELGNYEIDFTMQPNAAQVFQQYTSTHVGQHLTIVLDKRVLSSPTIQTTISDRGRITGQFTAQEASDLAIQLRYGSLPVALTVIQNRTIGPTLGEDSVRQSLIAGIIGLLAVAIFMILYYRLPGILAVGALLIYTAITFALYKWIPITLTLPGIAGFILSVGVAVDANILIFSRMKEELRNGRRLETAVDAGFARAWPSIRDSNASTLITCIILYYFGSNYGASIVAGFALTLALGVLISLFTAILVTRTFLHLALDRMNLADNPALFGV